MCMLEHGKITRKILVPQKYRDQFWGCSVSGMNMMTTEFLCVISLFCNIMVIHYVEKGNYLDEKMMDWQGIE